MLVLAQKEPILKAIIKTLIKIHKNVVFYPVRVKFDQMVYHQRSRSFKELYQCERWKFGWFLGIFWKKSTPLNVSEKLRTNLAIFYLYYIIFFYKNIEIQATYALPSETPKKTSSTANMTSADWVTKTEKGKNVVKLEGIFCTMT